MIHKDAHILQKSGVSPWGIESRRSILLAEFMSKGELVAIRINNRELPHTPGLIDRSNSETRARTGHIDIQTVFREACVQLINIVNPNVKETAKTSVTGV